MITDIRIMRKMMDKPYCNNAVVMHYLPIKGTNVPERGPLITTKRSSTKTILNSIKMLLGEHVNDIVMIFNHRDNDNVT